MKKQKFNQNVIVKETWMERHGKNEIAVPVKIVTTNTKLFIYKNDELYGSAGVTREADFDYDALYAIAKRKYDTSKIDVA